MTKYINLRTNVALGLIFAFLVNTFGPVPLVQAQDFYLPAPGVMVHLSPEFNPPILKGIKVHPDNPFKFEFILDRGDSQLSNDALKGESRKLIKYFLASLTIPEKDLWVNLSPYEKDRIIPQSFGLTEMGRDLLAEDYMLKQITASLIYPEDGIGKKFWKRIYEEAEKKFGTTNIPVNTFNKVWIVPEKAVVYENAKAGTAYVVESKLKVMLEQDYLSLAKHEGIQSKQAQNEDTNQLGSQIVREIVIPELTKEVNENKNFSHLRQVYNSLILATWYKKKIKDSILAQVYANRNKVRGLSFPNASVGNPEHIYQQYLKAFKKGAYNYIKEEIDPVTQETVPRKYFSGGVDWAMFGYEGKETVQFTTDQAMVHSSSNNTFVVAMNAQPLDMAMQSNAVSALGDTTQLSEQQKPADRAMTDASSTAKRALPNHSNEKYRLWFDFLESLGVQKWQHIIDVGNLRSHFLGLAVAALGSHYIGFGLDEPLVKIGQEELKRFDLEESGGSAEYRLGEFSLGEKRMSDDIKEHTQDFIFILSGALSDPKPESDPKKVLEEVLRVIKDGGRIVVGTVGFPSHEEENLQKTINDVLKSPEYAGKVELIKHDETFAPELIKNLYESPKHLVGIMHVYEVKFLRAGQQFKDGKIEDTAQFVQQQDRAMQTEDQKNINMMDLMHEFERRWGETYTLDEPLYGAIIMGLTIKDIFGHEEEFEGQRFFVLPNEIMEGIANAMNDDEEYIDEADGFSSNGDMWLSQKNFEKLEQGDLYAREVFFHEKFHTVYFHLHGGIPADNIEQSLVNEMYAFTGGILKAYGTEKFLEENEEGKTYGYQRIFNYIEERLSDKEETEEAANAASSIEGVVRSLKNEEGIDALLEYLLYCTNFKEIYVLGNRLKTRSRGHDTALLSNKDRTQPLDHATTARTPSDREMEALSQMSPTVRGVLKGLLTSEMVKGQTISQKAASINKVDFEPQVLAWFVDITEALSFIESNGGRHGDISDRNIVIEEKTNQPVIIDWNDPFNEDDVGNTIKTIETLAYAKGLAVLFNNEKRPYSMQEVIRASEHFYSDDFKDLLKRVYPNMKSLHEALKRYQTEKSRGGAQLSMLQKPLDQAMETDVEKGKHVVILIGPSGSGKSTFRRKLITEMGGKLSFVPIVTNRKPREAELRDDNPLKGEFVFLSHADFDAQEHTGKIVFVRENFKGMYKYGNYAEDIVGPLSSGKTVIIETSNPVAVRNLKEQYPGATVILFSPFDDTKDEVTNRADLQERLRRRGVPEAELEARTQDAFRIVDESKQFNPVVIQNLFSEDLVNDAQWNKQYELFKEAVTADTAQLSIEETHRLIRTKFFDPLSEAAEKNGPFIFFTHTPFLPSIAGAMLNPREVVLLEWLEDTYESKQETDIGVISDIQMAYLIAHEIAHIKRGHVVISMENETKATIGGIDILLNAGYSIGQIRQDVVPFIRKKLQILKDQAKRERHVFISEEMEQEIRSTHLYDQLADAVEKYLAGLEAKGQPKGHKTPPLNDDTDQAEMSQQAVAISEYLERTQRYKDVHVDFGTAPSPIYDHHFTISFNHLNTAFIVDCQLKRGVITDFGLHFARETAEKFDGNLMLRDLLLAINQCFRDKSGGDIYAFVTSIQFGGAKKFFEDFFAIFKGTVAEDVVIQGVKKLLVTLPPDFWTNLLKKENFVSGKEVGAQLVLNKASRDSAQKGGIDLASANNVLQTQNAGESIKFHLDPAQLAQLQNAPGFVPVIISVQPLTDLRQFLNS